MTTDGHGIHPLRAAVCLAATAPLPLLAWTAASAPVQDLATAVVAGSSTPVSFVHVVEAVAGLAVVACSAWLVLACLLVCCEASRTPGPRPGPRWCRPEWLRRALVVGGSATLGASLIAAPADAVVAPAAPTWQVMTGLPIPDRTSGGGRPGPEPVTTIGSAASARYTVGPGDSLWAIAERLIPRDRGPVDVATASHALHEANRDRLGADPDLVFPGTILRVPAPLISGKDRP